MIALQFDKAQVAVQQATGQDGKPVKMLTITDPQSGMTVVVPFDAEGAKRIGLQLSSSVLIAAAPLTTTNGGGHA